MFKVPGFNSILDLMFNVCILILLLVLEFLLISTNIGSCLMLSFDLQCYFINKCTAMTIIGHQDVDIFKHGTNIASHASHIFSVKIMFIDDCKPDFKI